LLRFCFFLGGSDVTGEEVLAKSLFCRPFCGVSYWTLGESEDGTLVGDMDDGVTVTIIKHIREVGEIRGVIGSGMGIVDGNKRF
jgi:hypothetical protein